MISPVRLLVTRSSNIQRRNYSATQQGGVKSWFRRNLFVTNCVTAGTFMAIGDLAQQEMEYRSKLESKRYDWSRAGRMFLVGAALAPMQHYYYLLLDRYLPQVKLKTILVKIVLDQMIPAPTTTVAFFYGMGLLEGKSFKSCTKEIKEKFLFVYAGDCMFWPPMQFINFYFLPAQYRVIYINFATMAYNIFLSYSKHYDHSQLENILTSEELAG